jgi:hypothetical protein
MRTPLIGEIGAANVQVQMDLYHCQIVEGDVAMKIRQYLPTGRVGHFQIAGVPQRHEPDLGELNYPFLFAVIDEARGLRLAGLGRLRIPAGARRRGERHQRRPGLAAALARAPDPASRQTVRMYSWPSSSCSTWAAFGPTCSTASRNCDSLQANRLVHQLTSRGLSMSMSPRLAGTVSNTKAMASAPGCVFVTKTIEPSARRRA